MGRRVRVTGGYVDPGNVWKFNPYYEGSDGATGKGRKRKSANNPKKKAKQLTEAEIKARAAKNEKKKIGRALIKEAIQDAKTYFKSALPEDDLVELIGAFISRYEGLYFVNDEPATVAIDGYGIGLQFYWKNDALICVKTNQGRPMKESSALVVLTRMNDWVERSETPGQPKHSAKKPSVGRGGMGPKGKAAAPPPPKKKKRCSNCANLQTFTCANNGLAICENWLEKKMFSDHWPE